MRTSRFLFAVALLGALFAVQQFIAPRGNSEDREPAADTPADPQGEVALATLGGGCFWCLEASYQELDGVHEVVSGYAGGSFPNPTYEAVCAGVTGHAEVVQIKYDPQKISYHKLLEIFWKIHDPTTLNRQGPDVGTQYRSIILYHDEAQKAEAEAYIKKLTDERKFRRPIVTQIRPLQRFYEAEAKHQDYYRKHPNQAYCRRMVAPKIRKVRALFADDLKPRDSDDSRK